MNAGVPADTPRGLSERACRLLAGAETGLAGGALVLAWLSFFARMQDDYWWSKWNVAGAVFYGDRIFTMGFGRASLAGAALLLVLYSLLGMAFSFLGRPRGFAFNLLAGLTVALLWHQLAGMALWPRWHPAAPRYLSPQVMLPAHVLFGAALIRFGPRFRRIAAALGDPGWAGQFLPPPAPPSPAAAAPAAGDQGGEPGGPAASGASEESAPDC